MRDGRFVMDHPALRSSYDYLRRLEDSGYAKHDDRGFRRLLENNLQHQYAMHFVPMHHLKSTSGHSEFRMAPWPTFDRPVMEDSMRKYLVVGRSTPAQEEASWKLVQWLVRPDVRLPTNIRDLSTPCRLDVVERTDYQRRIGTYTQNFQVVHETMGWPVAFLQPVRGRADALEAMEVIVTDLFEGKYSFDEAMGLIETNCNEILRNAGHISEPLALYR